MVGLLVWVAPCLLPCLLVADSAFTVSGGENVFAFDPQTGTRRLVGPTGDEPTVLALAFDSEGRLFGAAAPYQQPASLYRISTLNGSSEELGPLDLVWPSGLTFDSRGRLWLCADKDLYQVDPETGATTLMASYPNRMTALVAEGGRLLAVFRGSGIEQWLATIDLETLVAEPLYDLDLQRYEIVSASLDRLGNMWLIANRSDGNLSHYYFAFLRLDIATGTATLTYETVLGFGTPNSGFRGLALHSSGTEPLVVPTAGTVALAVFTVLMAMTALLGLRARP